jgi:acetyl-CoA acyltransferase
MAKAVIVSGIRTPFHKAFSSLADIDTIGLGVASVRALLRGLNLSGNDIDSIVWGAVIIPPATPNVAREIALDCLATSTEARTVSRACASSLQAVTDAVAAIERGDAEIVVAGGGDSTSNAAVTLPPAFIQKMGPVLMGGKASPKDILAATSRLNWLRDVWPGAPKVAERTTGETMGQGAERMAERNGISREAQDAFALRSHQRAASAVRSGRFDKEVCGVATSKGTVLADGLIRADTSLERLAKLKPAFKSGGTVTAGNASPLTDGAAAVLLMSAERAAALGYKPLAAVKSWSYVGVDPKDQLLIGPAIAMPKALGRAGLGLDDVDLIDMHEAFAAQVLSVVQALQSDAFGKERLGRAGRVGEIPDEKLNVHGGSLAIGHPFAATGARMVTTMANELVARDKQHAVLGLCAAGGLGASLVLERL